MIRCKIIQKTKIKNLIKIKYYSESNPISRILSKGKPFETVIPLGYRSPYTSSFLPGNSAGTRYCSPIWNCSQWGLASHHVTMMLVRSYRTFSPLPIAIKDNYLGCVFSVPLSVGSPRLRVTKHCALWSPDFPRHFCRDRPDYSQSIKILQYHFLLTKINYESRYKDLYKEQK